MIIDINVEISEVGIVYNAYSDFFEKLTLQLLQIEDKSQNSKVSFCSDSLMRLNLNLNSLIIDSPKFRRQHGTIY